MKVVLIDDDTTLLSQWELDLSGVDRGAGSDLDITKVDELPGLIERLESRQIEARSVATNSWTTEAIDEADIVVLDYDLANAGHAITGRRLAYFVRCFSTAGTILLMNEKGDNTFDLTLASEFESFADVEIGSQHIANPGLWSGTASSFRPWAWPVLATDSQALSQCESVVRDQPELPVMDALGLAQTIDRLPTSLVDQLVGGLSSVPALDELTFGQLVEEVTSGSSSADGLVGRKDRAPEESAARLVAARIRRWLNAAVAPSQDIAVDAPHLAARFPSLLSGDPTSVAAWDLTAQIATDALGVRADAISAHRLDAGDWSDRPRWLWHSVQGDKTIQEIADPFAERPGTNFSFCEDLSRFLPNDQVESFSSDLRPPFSRRFVAPLQNADVSYRPVSRLAS